MKAQQKICFNLIRQNTKPGAKVLEISCGNAEILLALQSEGYDVCGTNFTKHNNMPTDVKIHFGVDAREKLPFDDASFDVVVLGDIIEHVSDHIALISEISRVLKTDGISVVLAPNTNRINSRLQFLLTGFFKIKRSFIGFDVPADKAFVFHNYTPHLPVYLYQMSSYGLTLEKLDACGFKIKSIILWLMFCLFIFPATYIHTHFAEKNLRNKEGSRFLNKHLTTFNSLCGESWVTVHRKCKSTDQETSTEIPAWHDAP